MYALIIDLWLQTIKLSKFVVVNMDYFYSNVLNIVINNQTLNMSLSAPMLIVNNIITHIELHMLETLLQPHVVISSVCKVYLSFYLIYVWFQTYILISQQEYTYTQRSHAYNRNWYVQCTCLFVYPLSRADTCIH